MSMLRLVWNSLRFHWRMHAGAAGGTALAAAILTGALLVGDSAEYSLRTYALARLGSIHFAVESRGGFFSEAFVADLRGQLPARAVPVLTVRGMALAGDGSSTRQINQVNVVAVPPEFGAFAPNAAASPGEYETALNERQRALGVPGRDRVALRITSRVSCLLMLRFRAPGCFGAALCTVSDPARYRSGPFQFQPAQTAPCNALLIAGSAQLGLEGRVTALVGKGVEQAALRDTLRRTMGLALRTHPGGTIQLRRTG